MPELINLFPTPISIENDLPFDNDKLKDYCFSLQKKFPKGNGQIRSNAAGWQSHYLKFREKIEVKFGQLILHRVNSFAERIGLKYPLTLQNMWININGYKDFNWPHTHANAQLSGVYYVHAKKDMGNIVFEHPKQSDVEHDWITGINTKVPVDITTANSWWFPSETKSLILFPSWAIHRVNPSFNKKESRVSISFNCGTEDD